MAPLVCGVGFGGGSAPVVVDVCVATRMRGLVPHDRVCEMRSGAVLWRRAWPVGLLAVFSRVAPRVVAPVRSPRRADCWLWLLHRRECPAVSGEFAGDGDYHDRAGLASALERVPASVKPAGAPVRLRSHGERLACASAFERDAQAGRAALVPGGLDQEPARVRVAGLGDRALAAPFAA